MNNELINDLIRIVPACFTAWLICNQAIKAWAIDQKQKNREHIEAIVENHFRKEKDEFMATFKDAFSLFKDGTFK